MDKAEIRRNLQNGFKDVLRHILFYGKVRILRTRGINEAETFRKIVEKTLKIVESEKVRIEENENKILDDAREKGKKEGMDEFMTIIKNFINEKERLLEKIEETLMKRVILISEKVLEKELSVNSSCILSIIRNEVRKLCSDNITVVLNITDLEEIRKISPGFFEEMGKINVAISGDENTKRGECLIRCDSGEIDLSVKRRLTRLGEILK